VGIYKSLTDIQYECWNWEIEHYVSVLEITASILGIHKWEPDIYIGVLTGPSFVEYYSKQGKQGW
jgi:hypothetical protein